MNVNFANSSVYLEKNEAVEIVLPNSTSVWVYGNGTVIRPRRQKVSRDTSRNKGGKE